MIENLAFTSFPGSINNLAFNLMLSLRSLSLHPTYLSDNSPASACLRKLEAHYETKQTGETTSKLETKSIYNMLEYLRRCMFDNNVVHHQMIAFVKDGSPSKLQLVADIMDLQFRPVAVGSLVRVKQDKTMEMFIVVRESFASQAHAFRQDYLHFRHDLRFDGHNRDQIAGQSTQYKVKVIYCIRTGFYRLISEDRLELAESIFDSADYISFVKQLDLANQIGSSSSLANLSLALRMSSIVSIICYYDADYCTEIQKKLRELLKPLHSAIFLGEDIPQDLINNQHLMQLPESKPRPVQQASDQASPTTKEHTESKQNSKLKDKVYLSIRRLPTSAKTHPLIDEPKINYVSMQANIFDYSRSITSMKSISAVTSDPSRLIVAAIESNLQTLQSSLSLNSSSSEENLKARDEVSDPRYELKEAYEKMLKEDRQASIAETKGEYAAVNNLIIKYIG